MEASLAALLPPFLERVIYGDAKATRHLKSYDRRNAKGVQYMMFLVLTMPLVFCLLLPWICFAYLFHFLGFNFYTKTKNVSKFGVKTVLVTGAPHTKGLQVCRFMKSVGHRVILADMEPFRWNAARFSMAVDEWVTLPHYKYDPAGYEEAVKRLISDRCVDWWIPVSHTVTAPADCSVKATLATSNSDVKVLSYDSMSTVNMLDDKIAFLEECQRMSLPVPEFHQISSVEHVDMLRKQGLFRDRHFFLKPLFPYSEDRVNFDRIPDDQIQFQNYIRSFEKKITPQTPYFVSEYVKGPEYTGNCVSSNGELTLFTCNPSSPMQIDYRVAEGKQQKIFEWTKEFCRRRNITGSICFDFMEDPATGRMLAIECNPRLHSCIVLMQNQLRDAGEAFGRALESSNDNNNNTNADDSSTPACSQEEETSIVTPKDESRHVIWLYNEIGKLAHAQSFQQIVDIVKDIITGDDAVFDSHDPLPFFILGHIQIPFLIWAQIKSGKKWEILNFCLGQLR